MSNKYTRTANIFTYTLDGTIVAQCVRCLLYNSKDINIHVIDDDAFPITDSCREELLQLSPRVHYRKSTFERGGNLNGPEAVFGILGEMLKSTEHARGISFKIDSDTLIANPKLITETGNLDFLYTIGVNNYPSGVFYGINNKWLQPLIAYLNNIPLRSSCPEDRTILPALWLLTSCPESLILRGGAVQDNYSVFKAWSYTMPLQTLEDVASFSLGCVFGDWKKNPALTRGDALKAARSFADIVCVSGLDRD